MSQVVRDLSKPLLPESSLPAGAGSRRVRLAWLAVERLLATVRHASVLSSIQFRMAQSA
jgi:hypothetical protein